jgi:hypothetical protein
MLTQQRKAHNCLRHAEATLLTVHSPNDEEGADLGVGGRKLRNA